MEELRKNIGITKKRWKKYEEHMARYGKKYWRNVEKHRIDPTLLLKSWYNK